MGRTNGARVANLKGLSIIGLDRIVSDLDCVVIDRWTVYESLQCLEDVR